MSEIQVTVPADGQWLSPHLHVYAVLASAPQRLQNQTDEINSLQMTLLTMGN